MLENKVEATNLNDEHELVNQEVINKIIALTESITSTDGKNQTDVPNLYICRNAYETPPIPSILAPALCLILRGKKVIHAGKDIIYSEPGNFLASLIDIPALAQVIGATKELPYISLRIDFSTEEIVSVILDAGIDAELKNRELSASAFVGKADRELCDLFTRLLRLNGNPKKIDFLSPLIKREMIFHLLTGEYGYLFLQRAFFDQQTDGVSKAITWIKKNHAKSFTINELAKETNMSASSLQHKFKILAAMTPLQYQKQIQLQEARRLMMSSSMDVTTVAFKVGYESPTQFNREYKRLFGLPPLKDIKELQKNSINVLQALKLVE
ncbi:AraC family transcriptional regulator [uncultured Clostridium sp.]|uniref:AraC family transcriptional regulator n=1 Tax=uncultured Clostridium sp. TaxID=59620 RepID=UPI0028E1979C|nr:AraC family transcriptional regulator [uncultured Clostridium sp.]